ncbi:MAG: site-specific integrase [Candidatus Aminicenantes bacterium]|nr:site-specific integrase [Candidatus Aminicenantes bacterium]
MALFKRKNSNHWQMCFSVNGKTIRKSTKTANKKVAQRIFEKAKVEAAEGKYFQNSRSKMPFDQLVNEFLEKHSKVEKASYKSDISKAKALTRFFKQKPIGKITAYDIKSWRLWRKDQYTVRGKKVSKATVNRELCLMKTMFNLAVDWDWLEVNPAAKVKKLKGENQRMRFLNRDEVSRIIANCVSYLKPIVITAVSTGMRRGEIFNLTWKNVDFKYGFIHIEKSKNNESRDIPMDSFLCETLKNLKENSNGNDYVFCKEDGERCKSIHRSFTNACKKAEIEDFRFHDLRHTAASLYASGGVDLFTLKNILGHKTITMTQRYAHFIPNKHDKTRRVMSDFWLSEGDTVSVTAVKN